ncbi:hypothetical protein L873DRAFT_1796942 [Choiromyces venosus 120613-1]|uniref:Uncharacterized protein n=1 Tax=Choiromyces venosus 120613-1 TaxID=1336337 RepID=A0A3N4K644_9PEZI|nr:hypothetical protein L873DRAFT_1796942 [Choiromyces venosus 120613-1]
MGGGRAAVEGAKHVLVETWEALPRVVKPQRVILCAGNNNFNGWILGYMGV